MLHPSYKTPKGIPQKRIDNTIRNPPLDCALKPQSILREHKIADNRKVERGENENECDCFGMTV